MMIRSLKADRAALGLRAVGATAQTGDLLGKIGLHASMAEGKLNSNYVFKPTPDLALGSNRACGRRGLTRRWISAAVAGRWRASGDEVEALER